MSDSLQKSPESKAGIDQAADQGGSSRAVSSPNWVLENWARRAVDGLCYVCPFFYAIDLREKKENKESEKLREEKKPAKPERNWDLGRALWLLVSLGVLVVLWGINPGSDTAKLAVGFVAGWRLIEILVTGFGTALGQRAQVRARSLVSIAIYGLQITLIFAILYHSFATTGFAQGGAESSSSLGRFDYLYISWSAITSLGGTFKPTTEPARFLEVATTTAGIFLLGVLLAFGINEVQKKNQGGLSSSLTGQARDGQPAAARPSLGVEEHEPGESVVRPAS